MSFYRGKTETLRPVFEAGAWTIYDDHGPFDGPYESEGAAYRVINARREWDANATPFQQYLGY